MLRSILWGRLKDKYAAELAATEPISPDGSIWWRSPTQDKDAEQRARRRDALGARMNAELAELLGEPPPGPPRDARYGFLSDEKTSALHQLERDYGELRSKALSAGGQIGLERMKLVDQEWRRDLAALLTPSELAEYDVRFAADADMLRSRLGPIDGTEQEYRQLLALEKKSASDSSAATRITLQEEAARILGRERAANYFWGMEPGFKEVAAIAEKSGQPALAADFAEFRMTMTERAAAFMNDRTLSMDAKRAALLQVATDARTELPRRFPADVVAQFDAATEWIADLEQGIARTYFPFSSGYGSHALPPPAKTPRGP
jgi:hypothetical protein